MSPMEADHSPSGGGVVVRTKPMLLEVTIRPSPEDHQIGLRHSVFDPEPCFNAVEEGRRRDSWLPIILAEIADLREYLRKFYQLDSPPNFSSDPIDSRRAELKAEQERKRAAEVEHRRKAEADQHRRAAAERRAEVPERTTKPFQSEEDAEQPSSRMTFQSSRGLMLSAKPLPQARDRPPKDRLSLALALIALIAVSAAVVGLIRVINEVRADVQLEDVAGRADSSSVIRGLRADRTR